MASIVTVVIAFLAKVFTFETAKYLATRAMLIAIVMGLGPIVIFKGLGFMMKFLGNYGVELINSLLSSAELEPQVVNLYGVGAYLGQNLRVAEAISIFLSFLILKFTWSLLPRWGVPTGLVKY